MPFPRLKTETMTYIGPTRIMQQQQRLLSLWGAPCLSFYSSGHSVPHFIQNALSMLVQRLHIPTCNDSPLGALRFPPQPKCDHVPLSSSSLRTRPSAHPSPAARKQRKHTHTPRRDERNSKAGLQQYFDRTFRREAGTTTKYLVCTCRHNTARQQANQLR